MRWGWLFNRFEDPHLRLTGEQRRRALDVSTRRMATRLTVWTLVAIAAPVAVAMKLVWLVDDWAAARTGLSPSAAHFAMLGAIVLLVWPWSAWVYGRLYARPYRRALRESGVIVCEGCGYPMAGLEAPRCPECGWPAPPGA